MNFIVFRCEAKLSNPKRSCVLTKRWAFFLITGLYFIIFYFSGGFEWKKVRKKNQMRKVTLKVIRLNFLIFSIK